MGRLGLQTSLPRVRLWIDHPKYTFPKCQLHLVLALQSSFSRALKALGWKLGVLEHLAHLQLEALESIVVHHPPWLSLIFLSLHYHPTLAAPRPFYQDFRTHQKWIQHQEFQSFSGPISQELSFLLKVPIL